MSVGERNSLGDKVERRVYEKEGALVESWWDGFNSFVLLRLRGFLHAFHLVEMTG